MSVRSKTIRVCSHLLLANVVLLAACFVGCQQPQAAPVNPKNAAKPVTKVKVGIVSERELKQTITLPATLVSDETAMLMARVEGYVEEVLVDIGDEVQAGQTLVRLKAAELQQAVDEAKAKIQQIHASEQVLLAELSAARTQLDVVSAELQLKESKRDRRARLVSSGAIAEQLLQEAEADVQSTTAMLAKYENAVQVVEAKLAQGESELMVGEAKLAQANTLVDYLKLKAPFSGVVAERNVDPGNLVRPASQSSGMKPLMVLSKINKLRALVHATTDVAGQLTVGQLVEFTADDVPGTVFEGTLSRTAGTYNQKTRMMKAEIDLDNAPDAATGQRPLRAGSYGSATIVLQSAKLPVVPVSALRDRGGRKSVILVSAGECVATSVKVAFESGNLVAIAEGISADDRVVAVAKSVKDEQKLNDSEIESVNW